MGKKRILILRPAGLGTVELINSIWIESLQNELRSLDLFSEWTVMPWSSPWMAMGKNVACEKMIDEGFDYLMSVDPDMVPDLYFGKVETQKRFLTSSLSILEEFPRGIVCAPYCGPGPEYLVHVFCFDKETGEARRVKGGEAAQWVGGGGGVEQVASSGAGVLLMDREAVEAIPHPRWSDSYKTEKHTALEMSFDTNFGRQAYNHKVPLWCNWYSFAGHIQRQVVPCPGFELEGLGDERVIPHNG